MRASWLVLFVALVCAVAIDQASGDAFKQTPAVGQIPALPPRLVKGTLVGPKGPMSGQWLVFVGTTNRCPDTCSCDGDGTCTGGKECDNKLCVHGIITRTNSKGTFGVRLRPEKYDIHLDAPTGRVVGPGVDVGVGTEPLILNLFDKPGANDHGQK